MSISQHIKVLLSQKKLTQKQLSTFLGIASSTVNNWIKLDRSIPSEYIIPICEFFNVSPYFLLTGSEKKSTKKMSANEQELLSLFSKLTVQDQQRIIGRVEQLVELSQESNPVLIPLYYIDNSVSAGIGEFLDDYEQRETVYVEDTPQSRQADFILSVSGDSMEPKFHNGDLVLVRKQSYINVGDIGIFDIDGKGYIKQFGGDRLISLNPKYDDIIFDVYSVIQCFGIVLGTTEILG